MRCKNCGEEILPNTKFCRICGTKIENEEAVEAKVERCEVCGAILQPGARFCISCGNDTETKKKPEVEKTKTCQVCGETVLPGEKFCIHCGTPVEMEKTPFTPFIEENPPMVEDKVLGESIKPFLDEPMKPFEEKPIEKSVSEKRYDNKEKPGFSPAGDL